MRSSIALLLSSLLAAEAATVTFNVCLCPFQTLFSILQLGPVDSNLSLVLQTFGQYLILIVVHWLDSRSS